ncbi:hypothetical protein [Polyangium spumosum]|uniref:Bacterial virulence factor lipase N-terminal domain-containing protein n=1 Tax=Polyangium spumosum TaxID=889282 RepID=A0A6N7Q0V7_9BACT|nr:hypothetical protein [Polyangium spumosum]MRG96195.1 hypothetical protein [Polyangium spumosum]
MPRPFACTRRCVAALLLAAAGCGPSGTDPPDPKRTQILHDLTGERGFFGAPFPSDARLTTSGTADLSAFPNPSNNGIAAQMIDLAAEVRGFGTTTAIYFGLDGALPAGNLLGPAESLSPESPALLIDVSASAPDSLRRHPISASFLEDGGPYGAPHLLALLPVQGVPLRPNTTYAAVVRTSLLDRDGAPIGVSPAMADLRAGKAPAGMSAEVLAVYTKALGALAEAGISADEIAALTVFTTATPTDDYAKVAEAMLALPLPAPTTPFVRNEVFDDYCVYETTIGMPVYQSGEPPYTSAGGGWAFDAAGKPVLQRHEEANFVITVPRRPMPPAGYPIVLFSRTGAGGERPLVDRGVRAEPGGPAIEPGAGPALTFARAGFAGGSVDGPHGGLRNKTGGDEQFLVFNVGNPVALRDNIRQSAAELGLLAHVLGAIDIDVADCPGATSADGKARFDTNTLALMGHSMGASIVPLTAAFEPRVRALLLSGAGASFLANIVHKQKPLATRPLAESLVGVSGTGYSLTEVDPLLNLLQWAGEPADVQPYASRVLRENEGAPRHVLMMQGIVDHYILPPIANPMSLSLGLDLAGPALDASHPELAAYTPLSALLSLGGRAEIPLPAAGNFNGSTAVVVQHAEDGVEDGHEVVFQTEGPKHQMQCFLESLAKGLPRVPTSAPVSAPCE